MLIGEYDNMTNMANLDNGERSVFVEAVVCAPR